MPCLLCIVRPLCFNVSIDGFGRVKDDSCIPWRKWTEKRERIYINTPGKRRGGVSKELAKFLEKERKSSG